MANSTAKKERKFHDAWAFFLFIIFSIVMNTFYIIETANPIDEAIKLSEKYKFASCLFSNLGFTIIMLLVSLLLCYFIPKVLVVLSVFTVPAATIYFMIKSGALDDKNASTIAIVLFILNLIFIIYACIVVLSNLDYIACALRIASKIFFENFIGIFSLQILCLLIFVISSIPALLVNSEDKTIQASRLLTLFQMFWLAAILNYFMQVFISSVVFYHIKQNEESVFMNSFENSCYALGSISYGALLVAIISTLKAIVSNAREQDRNNQRSNGSSKFLLIIAEFFLQILGDILECANALAFPYLSVNGTDYTTSIVQSFQAITSSGYEKVASFIGIDFVIILALLAASAIIFSFNNDFLLSNLSVSVDGHEKTIYVVVLTFIFTVFYYLVFSLLRSAVLALIFAAATSESELKTYDPEFAKVLDEQKNKTLNSQSTQPQQAQESAR